MRLATRRFGEIDVEEDDLLTFPEGLVGLSRHKRFLLLQDPESKQLLWLQSVDFPEFTLATVPSQQVQLNYHIDVHPEEIRCLKLDNKSEAVVLLILNRVNEQFAVNLKGPLLLNPHRMLGKQVVLNDPDYEVRNLVAIDATVT
ncbi:Flagellar assembly factor FliW [Planctomycetes bacterium Pan216]|uniref:Flagellar assembly factor FliW n=1 Tax=Kolteria novifilia TaxID=2527975 RepID=A0A518AXU4_9BACT|nr:Flagellar assembly factor FliW [Planctomycetes bacterium Pan216]